MLKDKNVIISEKNPQPQMSEHHKRLRMIKEQKRQKTQERLTEYRKIIKTSTNNYNSGYVPADEQLMISKVRTTPNCKELIVPIADSLKLKNGKGKKCAIVGNAESLFTKTNGETIDQFDVVVRINKPDIILPEAQGSKTDIIFVHRHTFATLPETENPTYEVINVSDEAKLLTNIWSKKLRRGVNNKIARPTTGFLAISYMLNLGYDVTLFGFDWYQTKTYYKDTQHWSIHHPKWEEQTIKTLFPCVRIL